MSLEDIESLSKYQAELLYYGYLNGVYGNLGQQRAEYYNYCKLHSIEQILIATNSKRKKRPDKPEAFDSFAGPLWSFLNSKPEETEEDMLNKKSRDAGIALLAYVESLEDTEHA